MTKTEIYFGLCYPTENEPISDVVFNDFIQQTVVPRFDAFTILSGQGCWKGKFEPCKILVIIADDYDFLDPRIRETSIKIDKIREVYRRRFHQESVMCVNSHVDVAF
jgi:hypothetical protein